MEKVKEKKMQLVKIVYPGIEEMPEDIYSNNVRVTYSNCDIVLYFAKVDGPPLIEDEILKQEEIRAKVVARIRVTPKIAEELANVLKQSVESFKKNKELGEK